jgi:hypothetical protein
MLPIGRAEVLLEEAFGQYRRRRCPRLSVIARMLRQ